MGTRTVIEGIAVDGVESAPDEYSDGTIDVTVRIGREADSESATGVHCTNCSEPIVEYPGHDWQHAKGTTGAIGNPQLCGPADDDDYTEDELDDVDRATAPHDPDGPGAYVNWVGCTVKEDRVHVNISVGDPRGSFEMTLWKGDGGTLLLSVPRKDEPAPHVQLKHIGGGTYVVGPDLREIP